MCEACIAVYRRNMGTNRKTGRIANYIVVIIECCKVVEEDMRKLNITVVMAEDRKLWRKLISRPTPGEGNQGQYTKKKTMMMFSC